MSLLVKFLILVAVVWAALMPPLFTDGACTAEFDQESARLAQDQKSLRSPAMADAYWRERSVPHTVLRVDQCRKAKPRHLARCGSGPLVIARVPVKNRICSIYRDDEIRVQLHYDEHDRLSRLEVDMSPFKSLPIPFLNTTIHWAR